MKTNFAKILLVAACFSFGACAQFDSAMTKAGAWAASPQGQATINGVESAVTIAAGVYDGGVFSPIAAAAIQGANVGIRSLETGTAPTAAQVQAVIASVGGSPKVAAQIAPAISQAIASAVSSGVPASAAVEKVASVVDASSAKAVASGNP